MYSELTSDPYTKGRGVPSGLNVIPCSGPVEVITPVGEIVEGLTFGRMLLAGRPPVPAGALPKLSQPSEHHRRTSQSPTPRSSSNSSAPMKWPWPPKSEVPPARLAVVVLLSPRLDSPYSSELRTPSSF